MLRVNNISKHIGAFALQDISFDVNERDYFVLLGFSGAGKTLLLEILAGMMRPDSGQLFWNGDDITLQRIQHRGFGLVYQSQALFPHLSVFNNIAYGLRGLGLRRAEVAQRTQALAEETGAEKLLDRMPGTLSGGEAQRVALARALAVEPRCLLLDEPLASLDTQARGQMRALLRRLNRRGHTVIHVTHDYEEAVSLASRVGIMENGRVIQTGDPVNVFQHPASEFAARFIGIRNVFRGRLLETPNGATPRFQCGDHRFKVLTDAPPGPGCLMLRSEDVAISLRQSDSSVQNLFRGVVSDVAPARLGVEIGVEAGVHVTAWVTNESANRLALAPGKEVWIGFKASAARFIGE
jgi:molybdopterin-binding protein